MPPETNRASRMSCIIYPLTRDFAAGANSFPFHISDLENQGGEAATASGEHAECEVHWESRVTSGGCRHSPLFIATPFLGKYKLWWKNINPPGWTGKQQPAQHWGRTPLGGRWGWWGTWCIFLPYKADGRVMLPNDNPLKLLSHKAFVNSSCCRGFGPAFPSYIICLLRLETLFIPQGWNQ